MVVTKSSPQKQAKETKLNTKKSPKKCLKTKEVSTISKSSPKKASPKKSSSKKESPKLKELQNLSEDTENNNEPSCEETHVLPELSYVVCPIERRLSLLFTFIKWYKEQTLMVICNTWPQVKFYNELCTHFNINSVFIHEHQSDSEKKEQIDEFISKKTSLIFCTDQSVSDFEPISNVDWILQFDLPICTESFTSVLARASQSQWLCILYDWETPFLELLTEEHNVKTSSLDITWSKLSPMIKVQKVITTQYGVYIWAKRAYTKYMQAYDKREDKHIFDLSKLNKTKSAANFGFEVPPLVYFEEDMQKPKEKPNKKPIRKYKKTYENITSMKRAKRNK